MQIKDGIVVDDCGQPFSTQSSDRPTRLETIEKIVNLYFSPWGAAKAAMWEELSGDGLFSAERALELIRDAIKKPGAEGRMVSAPGSRKERVMDTTRTSTRTHGTTERQIICDGCFYCQDHCECGPRRTPSPCDLKFSPPYQTCTKCLPGRPA